MNTKTTITVLLAALLVPVLLVSAARTDNSWLERDGTYLETEWSEGRDILINGDNRYLNFDTTSGTGGYGFRDNAGVVETKNNGGSWESLATDSEIGGAFAWTPTADGNSTSTRLIFGNGFISQASSTITGGFTMRNATSTNFHTTNLSADVADITTATIANLTVETSFTDTSDATIVGDLFVNGFGRFGTTASTTINGDLATSTFSQDIDARIVQVSTGLQADNLTSALTLTGTDGLFAEYTGTTCTNQVLSVLSALGVGTCVDYVAPTRTVTIAGTENQITSSAGAQDLSANRTWTLSLPSHVIFPTSYQAAQGTTTNATSTNLTVTGNMIIEPLTSALLLTGTGGALAEYTGGTCTSQFFRGLSALGVPTCETVSLTADVTGTLPIANGGTNNTSAYTAGSVIFSNGTSLTQDNASLFFNDTLNRLGVGTTTPAAKINLAGNGAGVGMALAITDNAGATDQKHWLVGNNAGLFGLSTLNDSLNSLSTKLAITNAGNVGIGTTTPNNPLDIYSATRPVLGFSGSSLSDYKWSIGMDMADEGKFKISSSTNLGTNDRFVIDFDGFVGINNSTPSNRLAVRQDSGNTAVVDETGIIGIGNFDATVGTMASFGFGSFDSGVGQPVLTGLLATKLTDNTTTSFDADMIFGTVTASDLAERMRITSTGNVGIGTTTPSTLLEVVGVDGSTSVISVHDATTVLARLGDGGSGADVGILQLYDTGAEDIRIYTNGDSWLNGGNVGIGDATPDFLLDVAGTLGVDGNITLGDAVGDTVTANAGAWTFANDTTVALTGGVNGINFDSNTLSIDATNNRIGFGTAAPGVTLDAQTATDSLFNFRTTTQNYGSAATLNIGAMGFGNASVNDGFTNAFGFSTSKTAAVSDSSSVKLHIDALRNFTSGSSAFDYSVSANLLTIGGSGLFGFGTSTPITRMDIKQVNDTFLGGIILRESATNDSWGFVTGGDESLYIGSATAASGADAAGDFSTRFLITQAGNVGVATTTPWRTFSVAGTMANTGMTTATGGTNNDVCITSLGDFINESTGTCVVSSKRFKKDIGKLSVSALDMVSTLKPSIFKMKEYDQAAYKDQVHYGFIAEDLAKADPHLVRYGTDGLPRGIDDHAIMSVTVKAVQELRAENQALKARIEALEKKLK